MNEVIVLFEGMPRAELRLAIARQIAIHNHILWLKIDYKMRDQYMTLAENIIATVERKWRADQ